MKKITTIALAFILSSTLYARVCKEDGSQSQMNQCAYEEFQKADKELNRVYKRLRTKKKDDKFFLKKLTIAQRAWIKFRDAELESIFTCESSDNIIVVPGDENKLLLGLGRNQGIIILV